MCSPKTDQHRALQAIHLPGLELNSREAQIGSSREVLDQLSDLIPGVLVQTLCHPVRRCHNHNVPAVQTLIPVSARSGIE